MDTNKLESKYERIRRIGIGSYGVVFKCLNRQTGQIVAIKRYSENDTDPIIRKIAMREVRMLRQLKHPNLINLIEVFRRKRRLHLVFDYCELTVLDVIEKYTNNCPLNLIKKIIWQLVNGINYCHTHNCIHRDIKPENILINQFGVVKLCDFGFARNIIKSTTQNSTYNSSLITEAKIKRNDLSILNNKLNIDNNNNNNQEIDNNQISIMNSDRQALTEYVATRWYRAPELLIGEIYYDIKIDIWAIGCVTAELMRGEPIWPGKTDVDQLCIIKSSLGQLTTSQAHTLLTQNLYDQPTIEKILNHLGRNEDSLFIKLPLMKIGESGFDFVTSCLQMNPAKRLTSDELLKHPYIHSSRMSQFVIPNNNSNSNQQQQQQQKESTYLNNTRLSNDKNSTNTKIQHQQKPVDSRINLNNSLLSTTKLKSDINNDNNSDRNYTVSNKAQLLGLDSPSKVRHIVQTNQNKQIIIPTNKQAKVSKVNSNNKVDRDKNYYLNYNNIYNSKKGNNKLSTNSGNSSSNSNSSSSTNKNNSNNNNNNTANKMSSSDDRKKQQQEVEYNLMANNLETNNINKSGNNNKSMLPIAKSRHHRLEADNNNNKFAGNSNSTINISNSISSNNINNMQQKHKQQTKKAIKGNQINENYMMLLQQQNCQKDFIIAKEREREQVEVEVKDEEEEEEVELEEQDQEDGEVGDYQEELEFQVRSTDGIINNNYADTLNGTKATFNKNFKGYGNISKLMNNNKNEKLEKKSNNFNINNNSSNQLVMLDKNEKKNVFHLNSNSFNSVDKENGIINYDDENKRINYKQNFDSSASSSSNTNNIDDSNHESTNSISFLPSIFQ